MADIKIFTLRFFRTSYNLARVKIFIKMKISLSLFVVIALAILAFVKGHLKFYIIPQNYFSNECICSLSVILGLIIIFVLQIDAQILDATKIDTKPVEPSRTEDQFKEVPIPFQKERYG